MVNHDNIINLKLYGFKNGFKDLTRKNKTTMQNVLFGFVKDYVTHYDKYNEITIKEKMDNHKKLQEFMDQSAFKNIQPISITPIKYDFIEYINFSLEKVIVGSEFKGECHIKLKDGSNPRTAAAFFRSEINPNNAEVGIIDPVLQLDYPIYILLKNQRIIGVVDQVFNAIDEKIQEFKNEKEGSNEK